jgi:tetratricopeptide (TPR) repeat protein
VAFEKSLSIWKKVKDQRQIKRVAENVQTVSYYLGDITDLRVNDEENLKYWEQFPNSRQYASSLTNRGLVHNVDEEYETAYDLHQRAMKISDELGYVSLRVSTRINLAWTCISLQRYAEAEGLLSESIKLQEECKIKEFELNTKSCQVELEIGRGNYLSAIVIAEKIVKAAKKAGELLETGAVLRALGHAYRLNGDMKLARKALDESLLLLRKYGHKYEIYLTLLELANLYLDMNDAQRGKAIKAETQNLAEEIGIGFASSRSSRRSTNT